MTEQEKLVSHIVNHRRVEAAEAFNYAITQRAIDKLTEFKQQTAQKIYGKKK
jgi:hypothetical protein